MNLRKTNNLYYCPKCGQQLFIFSETNWDNLVTIYYPTCTKCNWTPIEHFYSTESVEEYLKSFVHYIIKN